MLDLRTLDRAIGALSEALRIYDANPLAEDAPEKVVLRDGVIQRFEFTFELAWNPYRVRWRRIMTQGRRSSARPGLRGTLRGFGNLLPGLR